MGICFDPGQAKPVVLLLLFLVGCTSLLATPTCIPTWRTDNIYIDLDCSTTIDIRDAQIVANSWRQGQGDVNTDGQTNIVDIMLATRYIGAEAYLTGWYSGFSQWYPFEDMSAALFTIPYISERHYSEFDIDATLERMRNGRIQGFLELERRWVRDPDITAIENFVQSWDSHPSVYGWYIFDEPMGGIPIANFLAAAEAIRRNSQKPIAVALCCGQSPTSQFIEPAASWYDGFDILMYDWYPIYNGTAEFEGTWPTEWTTVLDYYGNLAAVRGKEFIPILQAHGCRDDGTVAWGKRDPTTKELEYLFWTSAVRDTKGALWFAHYRSRITPSLTEQNGKLWCAAGLNDGIRPKIQALHALVEPVSHLIAAGVPSSDLIIVDGITYKYGSFSDKRLLIAVNESAVSELADFNITDIVSGTATVIGENRSVPIQSGHLQDSFNRFDTNVYLIEGN